MARLRYNFQDKHIAGQKTPVLFRELFKFISGHGSVDVDIVAAWRTPFGRYIRLEFMYYARIPHRCPRSPTQNDKFGLSRANLTFASWPRPQAKFLTLTFLGQHAYFSMRIDMRNAMVAKLFDISFSSKIIAENRFLQKTAILTFLDLQSLIWWRWINSHGTVAKDQFQNYRLLSSAASYL